MSSPYHIVLACSLAVAGSFAQHPDPARESTGKAPIANPFTAPIRSGEDDNGHRCGTWGSGPDYKASFHDGFAFYPVLGERYPHNLPLRWQTSSVRVGHEELLVAGREPVTAAGDWRFEYRFGAVTEAYELRKDGVEQTFVLAHRPPARGELVIEGRVDSELGAAERGFAHAPLTFSHADGTPVLAYGAATAVDAAGRRFPMDSAFANGVIRLRLAAKDLAAAEFPLVVDPLLGNLILSSDAAGRLAADPNVARDGYRNELMTVYTRVSAGTDHDAFAVLCADDFTGGTLVWTDLTANWSTRNCDLAFVGGASRWILVLQRDFPSPTGSALRFHTRASGDLVPSTSWTVLAGTNGNLLTAPDVGGTDAFSTGSNALVVYQSDAGLANAQHSEVYARLVDVAANTVGPAINLEPGATLDRETPAVNQISDGGTSSWIVCWTQLDYAITEDDWDIVARRIDSSGVSQGRSVLGNRSSRIHNFLPKVAGRGSLYAVSYGENTNPTGVQPNAWAEEIWIERFVWQENLPAAVPGARGQLRRAGARRYWNGDIAYDSQTDSHFALVYHSDVFDVFAARVGYDAQLCESVTVHNTASSGYSPAITFDRNANRFPIVYVTDEGGAAPAPVRGVLFEYPSFPDPLPYGVGCGPAYVVPTNTGHARKPHCGSAFFQLSVFAVPNDAPGVLNLGLSPDSTPIPGLPGCFSNVGTLIASLGTPSSGSIRVIPLQIPSGISADLFVQFLYADPGSPNPIPVSASPGLQILIR
ncbi:MAG: hypothetical protein IT457_06410 [Planctomycetes bacterium]|nr:hypothetical protein [Planctomycetota bacterium]